MMVPPSESSAGTGTGTGTPFFDAEMGDDEDPEVASESAAGGDEDVLFQTDRMDAALSQMQNFKDRLPLRPSKFSMHKMEQQANNSQNGDPFWAAFGERVPPPNAASQDDPHSSAGSRPATTTTKTGFAASKLGIPALPLAHEELQKARSAAAAAVHYLHIPENSMKDFQSFAQSAANEAIVENNPYIRALNSHRAKLQQPLFDTPRTLEQLMATDPSSLAQLHEFSERSVRFSVEEEMVCGPSAAGDQGFFPVAFASCMAFGTVRCGQRARCEDFGRDEGRRETPKRRCAVQQLAVLSSSASASFAPGMGGTVEGQSQSQSQSEGRVARLSHSSSSSSFVGTPPLLPRLESPVGSPSCSSTALSSPQVCDEADAGTGAIRQASHSRSYFPSAVAATGGSSSSTARRLLMAESDRDGSQTNTEVDSGEMDSEVAAAMEALVAEAEVDEEGAPQSSTKASRGGGPTLLSRQRFFGGVFTKVKV
mmetsp:Transcript_71585/g.149664  ORF Transcript_71585/g.149664 Transcript_71585/m.149664 type:complete len:482 (+) Transcript_71585:212-1657(+)|eukprot:CAMPEP_0206444920 /NCGR_PEP_ID=MMETSP0324_2-20121206/15189_1 /ASSEMBLY_ACC=CAM_ASM_000836 /TAXON_ID=2866 /ORGANISM="Crypthecodinium cohnii, Strain Seligo" /LENGTH=481 /DNA_ID=CAMNT_0053913015 /DNA_START=143 /DNA_END=1588 /DNA_ORIENTATION=+